MTTEAHRLPHQDFPHYNTHMVCDYTSTQEAFAAVWSEEVGRAVRLNIHGVPMPEEFQRMASILNHHGIGNFRLFWDYGQCAFQLAPIGRQ